MSPSETIGHVIAGQVWNVPAGMVRGNLAICRGCPAQVMWVTTPAGKRMPIDQDGTSHFATCPQADQFRTAR